MNGMDGETDWVPGGARAYLRAKRHSTRALEDMEPHIREWDSWMRAVGEFYDYRYTDGYGRLYQLHRRTIMQAMRVCREWGGSLLQDEMTTVACDSQECTDWLGSFFSSMNFWGRAQETVVRAFGLGTGPSPWGWTPGGRHQISGAMTLGWRCRLNGTRREYESVRSRPGSS